MLISVLVVKPFAAQIAAGVQTKGGRDAYIKGGGGKNKGFARRKQPPVSKPVKTSKGEEFLKILFISLSASLPINRISQSTFSQSGPQNGGARARWLRARPHTANRHRYRDGHAVSMAHSTEHCCHALCSRPRSPWRSERASKGGGEREREKGRSGRKVESKSLFSQRNQ